MEVSINHIKENVGTIGELGELFDSYMKELDDAIADLGYKIDGLKNDRV